MFAVKLISHFGVSVYHVSCIYKIYTTGSFSWENSIVLEIIILHIFSDQMNPKKKANVGFQSLVFLVPFSEKVP